MLTVRWVSQGYSNDGVLNIIIGNVRRVARETLLSNQEVNCKQESDPRNFLPYASTALSIPAPNPHTMDRCLPCHNFVLPRARR